MNTLTLANVFHDSRLNTPEMPWFSLAEMEKTASLVAAEEVENVRNYLYSLVSMAKDRFLDISLTDIMLGAWTKMHEIQEFATGGKKYSDKTQKVVLSQYKITSVHSPTIELWVYENKIAEVTIKITLTLVVVQTNLMIKEGKIMEVKISGCKAMGELSFHGQKFLKKESAELDFPSSIKFADGIVIPPPLKRKIS